MSIQPIEAKPLKRAVLSEAEVLDAERARISQSRRERLGPDNADAPWSGIGLSGGGIRSASRALGVLQALAEHDLLRKFDYLSSVSGGGYLAGSLQWWWCGKPREDGAGPTQTRFGLGPTDFPYGPARISTGPEQAITQRARCNLAFLRSHSSYLTPGNGLNSWSMLAVLVRTSIISLFIWIMLLTGCFVALHLFDYNFLQDQAFAAGLWSPLGTLMPARWPSSCLGVECQLRYRTIYALALYIYYGVAVAFFMAAILFAFLSRAPQGPGANWSVPKLLVLVGLAVWGLIDVLGRFARLDGAFIILTSLAGMFLAIAAAIIVAELRTAKSLNASYFLRRNYEKILGAAFIPSLAVLAVATIPLLPYFLLAGDGFEKGVLGGLGGVVGLLSGVASALYGYYIILRNLLPSLSGQILATVGACLYLYVTLVIAYLLAIVWQHASLFVEDWGGVVVAAIDGGFVVAVFLGVFANINYVGLHRFYRDRLMEALMPTDGAVTAMQSRDSPVADNLLISELGFASGQTPLPPLPYPLINTNAIMINDADQKVALRGGDNFVISPLFVGSSVTGWRDSADYIKAGGPLTLASSVAASGAAATASAGYIGTGITMNPLVATVMSLLNVRLGLWVTNPGRRKLWPWNSIPTFLFPGLVSDILSKRHSRNSNFLELTDGGHFENLGLYELVRRKLRIILIVDGEADPSISLSSLVSAARRIEQDFKATLTFPAEAGLGPERLIMYEEKGYPSGRRAAQSPFLVGRLDYDDRTSGTLIYFKSTLIKEMDFTTAGYLATNPTFPHQSTVDQFFDPDQFDAYRYLGYDGACELIKALQLNTTLGRPDDIVAAYRRTLVAQH
ncbi:hypothetical protein [Rhodopseudomonas sp. BAL398]|nr:hypothetical protein [Rhodopseudomonas sp. BAL398]MDF3813457.1 hypothetical protein [Rhodopseudomonas sp. BAL398]WOK18716.1 hypothetical protein RBJ75_04085 [Rhodopseudomonas sp. BAL398]